MSDADQNEAGMSQEDIDALLGGAKDSVPPTTASEQDASAGDASNENAEKNAPGISQEDIDGLLGMASDADEAAPVAAVNPTTIVPRQGVRRLDLLGQERSTRARMPTMEVLNDRFSRSFRGSLFNYLRVNADITPLSAQLQKYGDFIGKVNLPSFFVMATMSPLHGSILFILDPYLCYGVIEAFFGGNGRIPPKLEGRDFSVIEQRVFNNIIKHAMEDFSAAWEPIVKLELKALRSDVKSQFVGIATASEIVVASAFDVEMERWRGKFYICFPYQAVEPFRDQLVSGVAPDQTSPDANWQSTLHKDIQDAQVNAYVLLASRVLSLQEALRIKEGEIIYFDKPEQATLYVEDIAVADGQYGLHKNKYALQVSTYRHPDKEDILKAVFDKKDAGKNAR